MQNVEPGEVFTLRGFILVQMDKVITNRANSINYHALVLVYAKVERINFTKLLLDGWQSVLVCKKVRIMARGTITEGFSGFVQPNDLRFV